MKTLSKTEQIDAAITALEVRVARLDGGVVVPPVVPPVIPPVVPPVVPPTVPPVVPPPVDVNVYPLRMPEGIVGGATVNLGVGPDTLTLAMGSDVASPLNTFVVLERPSKRVLAGPLTVSSVKDIQWFHIHGSFGPAPKEFEVVGGNLGASLGNLWAYGYSYNFATMCRNGPSLDARGVVPPLNQVGLWDNIGMPFTISTEFLPVPPPVVVPPPPPPLPESIITGAIGSAGMEIAPGTLQSLVDAAGASLKLPAGTFVGTASLPNGNPVSGAGRNLTTITAVGIRPKFDKGVFVPMMSGSVIEDMTITGANIAGSLGGNAAAVRGEPNVSFTLRRVEVTGNQNGVLTPGAGGGDVTIEDCYFHDNGNGNPGGGNTHEVYLGSGHHVITGSKFVCGLLSTHAVKSRGASTTMSDCELVGNGDDGAVGGAVLDVPNGGLLAVSNTILEIKAGAGNHNFFKYGADNVDNGAGPVTLDVKLKGNGVAGIIESATPIPLTISGTYTGSPPEFRGWGAITNTLVAA